MNVFIFYNFSNTKHLQYIIFFAVWLLICIFIFVNEVEISFIG